MGNALSRTEEKAAPAQEPLWPALDRKQDDLVRPLLKASEAAARGAAGEGVLDDAALIEQELRGLFRARAMFLKWVASLREDHAAGKVTPTQFLRAWNDSTTRVIQLLRARRAFYERERGPYDELADRVYDALEAYLEAEGLEGGGQDG